MNQIDCKESLLLERFSPQSQKSDLSTRNRKISKTFVLDTNVLIHDPNSIFSFDRYDVVIPSVVLEELDKLKKGYGEIASSARDVLRIIDRLREKGSLTSGIEIGTGGMLFIGTTLSNAPTTIIDGVTEDNKIIKTALSVAETRQADESGDIAPAILVSKDTSVRIQAEACGLHSEDYESDKTTLFQIYGRVLSEADYTNGIRSIRYLNVGEDIYRLQGCDNQTKIKNGKSLEGISPKNVEQRCAIDALINPDIEVVALTGSAGTVILPRPVSD